jgi:hypothetical protein
MVSQPPDKKITKTLSVFDRIVILRETLSVSQRTVGCVLSLSVVQPTSSDLAKVSDESPRAFTENFSLAGGLRRNCKVFGGCLCSPAKQGKETWIGFRDAFPVN